MEIEDKNGGLLSSWKEIAAYLKCAVRSCIRWEKELGLPIHRMTDARGSRVFAYKKELDEWLKAQPVRPEPGAQPRRQKRMQRAVLTAVAVLALIVAALFVLVPRQPGPEPFHIGRFSIITSEPLSPGRLRVWEAAKSGAYRPVWEISTSRFNTVMHSTVASGDIDGDGRAELAAPAAVRTTYYRGEKAFVYYRIFLNAYKQKIPGIWKTTFYQDKEGIWEDTNFTSNEIVMADLEGSPANEIVLKTAGGLGVFRYDPETKEIRFAAGSNRFMEGRKFLLRSVAVADIGAASPKTILVSAEEVPDESNGRGARSGWLFFVEYKNGALTVVRSLPVDAGLDEYALRTGDPAGTGRSMIFATAVRTIGGDSRRFLLGWDGAGQKTVDIPLPEMNGETGSGAALEIQDVTFERGDDIIIGLRPRRILLYSMGEAGLTLRADHLLDTRGVTIHALGLGDTDGDRVAELIVGGGVPPRDGEEGTFFLESLVYMNSGEFQSEWKRVGGAKDERPVRWLIVGRDRPRK